MSRCIVITGASRGIGLHVAMRAQENGYDVIGMARTSPLAPAFRFLECDVTDPYAVAGAFHELRSVQVYGLINTAGTAAMNLHLTTPYNTMQRVINCNLLGTMYCCAEAGRLMARTKRGRIINFSSIAVSLGLAGESAYVAAKAGIEGFTRAFAREMAPFGVTVNAIAPGPVPTSLIAGVPEAKIAALRKRQVIQVPITTEDIWNIAAWLLSEESSSISGDILRAGGA